MVSPGGEAAAAAGASQLFNSKEYSDLLLVCNGTEFSVHKFVVCPRSKVIKRWIDGPAQEGRTSRVEMQADTASVTAVGRLVSYLYVHKYDDAPTPEEMVALKAKLPGKTCEPGDSADSAGAEHPSAAAAEIACHMVNNTHMYALGDYYDIPDLRTHAKDMFEAAKNYGVVPVVGEVISEVFTHTALRDPLRASAVDYAAKHRDQLAMDNTFLDKVCVYSDFMIAWTRASNTAVQSQIALFHNQSNSEKADLRSQPTKEINKASSDSVNATSSLQQVQTSLQNAENRKTKAENALMRLEGLSQCPNPNCKRGIQLYAEQKSMIIGSRTSSNVFTSGLSANFRGRGSSGTVRGSLAGRGRGGAGGLSSTGPPPATSMFGSTVATLSTLAGSPSAQDSVPEWTLKCGKCNSRL